MSSNRLNFDTCQYKQKIVESTGPGNYMLNTPPVSCEPCYPFDPSVRLQRQGNSIDTSRPLIDINSELLNIVRPASKCPSRKWIPKCPNCNCDVGEPCGQGVSLCRTCSEKLRNGERCVDQFSNDSKLTHYKDCNVFSPDETRNSNPACNLRGTGFNRWDWVCMNPQDRVQVPFDWNINNRILVKDNHRPCVPTPINQLNGTPSYPDTLPCQKICPPNVCAPHTEPVATSWKSCSQIQNL